MNNEIPVLKRFTKTVILDELSMILEINYVYNNNSFYHQMKATAMENIFAVVRRNLTVAYYEEKMFAILQQVYPKDFAHFFICNYIRF